MSEEELMQLLQIEFKEQIDGLADPKTCKSLNVVHF